MDLQVNLVKQVEEHLDFLQLKAMVQEEPVQHKQLLVKVEPSVQEDLEYINLTDTAVPEAAAGSVAVVLHQMVPETMTVEAVEALDMYILLMQQ